MGIKNLYSLVQCLLQTPLTKKINFNNSIKNWLFTFEQYKTT
jgi:hypothetical protein